METQQKIANKQQVNYQSKIPFIIHSHLQNYHPQNIVISHLTGLTNQTFKISCLNQPSLVFRKFSQMGDRQIQNKIFALLESKGIAPKCLFANKQYRIQLYIENCRHPTLDELKDTQIKKKILQLMHNYHQVQVKQANLRKPLFEQALSQEFHEKVLSFPNIKNEDKFLNLQQIFKKAIQNKVFLKQKISLHNQNSLAFCHNDLNNLNIFIQPQLFFIDFQYSSYNYVSYDIANFLNQSTINYNYKEFPFFSLQRSIQKQQISEACSYYLSKYQNIQKDVLKSLAICNLFWAGWSLMMANDESQKGFGTIEHGLMRMNQFHHYLSMID